MTLRFFLISFALHSAFLLLQTRKQENPVLSPPVEIEAYYGPRSRGRGGGGKGGSWHGTLKDLRIPPSELYGAQGSVHEADGGGAQGDGNPWDGSDPTATSNALNVETYFPILPFFEQIWRKLDALTIYPEPFYPQRIQGSVHVRLTVDRQGVWDGKGMKIESDSSYLEPYVLGILLVALKDPLPTKYHVPQPSMPLSLAFEFKILTDTILAHPGNGGHLKNSLVIKRAVYMVPKYHEEIDRIMTHYFPPILILPGGVFIDVIRLHEFIQNIGKRDQKEISKSRAEMLRQRYSDFVKKKHE